MKANTIEEFFGTLLETVVEAWKEHLKTDKYFKHIALDEFYKEMPELVDTLIENYIGIHGKPEGEYKNIASADEIGAVQYLEDLRQFVQDGVADFCADSELKSDADAILSQIDSTLYKLKELKEGKLSLQEYLNESLVLKD